MMPNGFYGSVEEWQRLTQPLEEIVDQWETFAKEHGMTTIHHYHNWPNLRMGWGPDIKRYISVSLLDEQAGTYSFAINAWLDRDGKRYGHGEVLLGPVPWPEMRQRLPELLEEGYRRLSAWTQADLVKVIDL